MILGDINLDYVKKHCVNYAYKNLLEDFEETLSHCNLVQIVDTPTWSHIINESLKESLLDHIYVTDPSLIKDISMTKPCFGDHQLVMVDLILKKCLWKCHSREIGENIQSKTFVMN